jgi:hypothetical protein
MHVAYYVSGHGYGHGVRASAVANALCSDTRLTVRSSLPESFFREEIRRDFSYVKDELDCGCLQSDCVTVDIEETARRYAVIAEANAGRLDEHAEWLRGSGVDIVVSDIVPFAFEAARAAGVPSVAVSNFSWLDIYAPYVERISWFRPHVEHIERQCAMADLLLALHPPNALKGFGAREEMPIVGREGRDRRDEIVRHLGIDPGRCLGLVYVGVFGLDTAPWERLERFREWEFFGIHRLHAQPVNYHVVDKKSFRYQDLSASVDCVIAKLGYGVYAESLLHGVPLVFFPRVDFAEYPVLERSILDHGSGIRLEREHFCAVQWEQALDRVRANPRPRRYPNTGAKLCARRIEQYVRRCGG